MGYQDNFKKPVSLGRQYLQIGNSVCVPMVEQIARWILSDMCAHEYTYEGYNSASQLFSARTV
jgi:hypothetical protein